MSERETWIMSAVTWRRAVSVLKPGLVSRRSPWSRPTTAVCRWSVGWAVSPTSSVVAKASSLDDDHIFMGLALEEAEKARKKDEIPVGAVLVDEDQNVIAKAHNLVESMSDPTAHAELLCIRHACKKLESWRLINCTLYVTLEPCPMCAGALLQSRLTRLVWGAPNHQLGADG